MNDLYKDYLLGWASKYIDDVTDLEIKGRYYCLSEIIVKVAKATKT